MSFIINKFKKFINDKRYIYFLPKFLRFKIFNIKKLKLYKTKTGNYYLPQYAIKDIIRNTIIADHIFDEHILDLARKYIKPDTIVLDLGSNFGQLGILFSKTFNNVEVYCFEASKYIYNILEMNIILNKANAKPYNFIISDESKKSLKIQNANLKDYNT